ncbi:uncharacterized protein C8R40DRAFT_1086076 [Lentinula edodes]|uniref:uncharacterized protein n=1 Tax=Lentinula edodes TaxID=5353 RepID=UPI001E8E4CA5|nr:uncharacterized protein C8R40DRAFT_1086076 [Lentinula edodes]KAH7879317.1 hypothetical protein C8R40DRAFT_1086076 [Lentinula edodes]
MRTRNALLCAAAVTSVCLAVESPVVAKDPFAFGAGCISTLISLCRRYRNPRNRIRARWKEKNVRRLHRMLRTRQVKWKELDDANLRLHTRFDKDGLSRLIKVLHIPDPFVTTRRGYRFQAFDALCILS